MAVSMIATLAGIGIFAGIVSGLFGVGGGLIFVPLLILLRQFDPHLAIGTSIAVVVPTAMMAAFRHHLGGMVDWKTVAVLAVFSILGAWVGAALSLKLPVDVLRRALAVFLVFIAAKLFFQN